MFVSKKYIKIKLFLTLFVAVIALVYAEGDVQAAFDRSYTDSYSLWRNDYIPNYTYVPGWVMNSYYPQGLFEKYPLYLELGN